MAVQKIHTGIVITKDGEVTKKFHETPTMWVVNKTECYRKDNAYAILVKEPAAALSSNP
uniref:Uncharacterized protein n=1 Tax=Raoultella ornithinolytica TaxID=54291 RepID=A0A1V0M397_RAOOR|nr:Hypothetical protein [Raoultella ornithinolytica]